VHLSLAHALAHTLMRARAHCTEKFPFVCDVKFTHKPMLLPDAHGAVDVTLALRQRQVDAGGMIDQAAVEHLQGATLMVAWSEGIDVDDGFESSK
jgi:hypothetical protein